MTYVREVYQILRKKSKMQERKKTVIKSKKDLYVENMTTNHAA